MLLQKYYVVYTCSWTCMFLFLCCLHSAEEHENMKNIFNTVQNHRQKWQHGFTTACTLTPFLISISPQKYVKDDGWCTFFHHVTINTEHKHTGSIHSLSDSWGLYEGSSTDYQLLQRDFHHCVCSDLTLIFEWRRGHCLHLFDHQL